MPRPPCRVSSIARALDIGVLDRLADALLDRPHDVGGAAAEIVRAAPVRGGGGEIVLSAVPDGVHPADALLGLRVSSRWTVVGVVASGTAHRLDEGTRTWVRMVVLVDRHGRCVHRVGGDAPLPDTSGTPLKGRMVDLVQRSLGLPTAPPDLPPSALWDVLWLDAVVTEAAAEPARRRRFEDVVRRHPLLPEGDARSHGMPPCDRTWDDIAAWRAVRRATMGRSAESVTDRLVRRAVGPLVASDVAEWMDEGCLARWVFGALPPGPILLDAVGALLPPDVAARVRDATGLPTDHDPRGDVVA